MLRRAYALRNLLFYAYWLCLIDQTQTFSLAYCPAYAGNVLFCAGSWLNKEIEQWVSNKVNISLTVI